MKKIDLNKGNKVFRSLMGMFLVVLSIAHIGCNDDPKPDDNENGEEGIYIGTTLYSNIKEALDAAQGTTAVITVKNYQYGIPFSSSYTIPENTHITIEGEGSVEQFLSAPSSSIVYFILDKNSSSLTLNNIVLNKARVKISDGTFVMLDGAKIEKNNQENTNGGGVVMSGGVFIMKEGSSITNNTIVKDEGSGYNYISRTGRGGAVHLGGGTFTMEGGEIYENTASYTGGLYITGGDFIMKGGRIYSNVATSSDNNYNLFISYLNDVQDGTAVYSDGTPILEPGTNGTNEDITGR